MALFGLLISAPTMLVVGLPYVLFLRRHGMLTSLTVCAGATLVGAIIVILLFYGDRGSIRNADVSEVVKVVGLGSVFGMLSGIGFCLGARPQKLFGTRSLN